jgi:hypothetical protein
MTGGARTNSAAFGGRGCYRQGVIARLRRGALRAPFAAEAIWWWGGLVVAPRLPWLTHGMTVWGSRYPGLAHAVRPYRPGLSAGRPSGPSIQRDASFA